MRSFAALVLAMLFTVPLTVAKDESVQQLVDRANSARVEDQPALYSAAAERQLKSADQLYTAGKVDDARAAVADVVTYSDKASSAAIQSGKKLKNTEIAVRRMAAKLRDLKRSLAFEDQSPVQAAIDRLETLRTQLLTKMFGKSTK
jgi:competence protein ComGC